MATNLPSTIPDLINWCSVHQDLWSTNAVAIGLSSAQATSFKALVATMVTNNGKADAARQASKNATMDLTSSVNSVRTTAGAYINLIKAFAETTHNDAVYSLAGVSADDPPSILPAPIAPATFGASINGDGSLTVKWKVTQPDGLTGVQYLVSRRMQGQTTFTMLSSEGKNKSFTDMTLPVGVDRVEYIVQPKRGEVFGDQSHIFTVQFGSVMGGGMSIATIQSVPHDQPMKIAA